MAHQVRRAISFTLLAWCAFSLLVDNAIVQAQGDEDFLVLVGPDENATSTILPAGNTTEITFTILEIIPNGDFNFTIISKDEHGTFKLAFTAIINLSKEDGNYTVEVAITGIKVGIAEFDLIAVNKNNDVSVILTHYVKVNRIPNKAAKIVRYAVTVAVFATIWLIGITTDVDLIIQIIKRPYGVITGMLCQFIIMPFSAWCLAKIFKIDGAASVGLVLDGSCPGGSNSNLFSVLLDVDYVLSITMTFFSTIAALGMMPLNLFIYGRSFVSGGVTIQTPFLEIFIQLVFLVVPLGIGIFLGWKWPKLKNFAEKYIKPLSAIVVVVLLCTDLPFNLYIFDSPWNYFCAAMIFPLIGATAGFVIATLVRLSKRQSLTVGLETGVQNALVAVSVLYFFYPQPEADLAIRLPYLILIFTTFEGIIAVVIYTLLKKFYWHGVPYKDETTEDEVKIAKGENNNESQPGVPSVSSSVNSKQDIGQTNAHENAAYSIE